MFLIAPSIPLVQFLFISAISLALLCLFLHYLIYSRCSFRWKECNLPYLKPTFLLGHPYFFNFFSKSAVVGIDQIYRENPDKELVAFFMLTVPLVLIRDPKLIRPIIEKNFDKMYQTGITPSLDAVEAQSMINVSSVLAQWKFARNLLKPMFSFSKMGGSSFTKIKKQIARMLLHTENSRASKQPFIAQKIAHNFVTDFISLSTFGEDTNSYTDIGNIQLIAASYEENKFRRLLSFLIHMHWPSLQRFRAFQLVPQISIDMMTSLLKRQMESRDSLGINEGDFIDFLRSLRGEIDMRQMVGFSFVLIKVGLDAVATLAIFALHLLSLHPEYQDSVKDEIESVMEQHKETEVTFEVVKDLQLTKQCLLETARLFPILVVIIRTCTEDFQIPGTEYVLRKGEKVAINPYSIHRDPNYFEDPDNFNPDRFSPQHKGSIASETFLGFGIGQRKCPGSKLGILTAATLIAPLIQKYELSPYSHTRQMDVHDFYAREIMIQPKRHVLLNLKLREK